MFKQYKFSLLFASAFLLAMTNMSFASVTGKTNDSNVEKLAEYNALDFAVDAMEGSNTVFQGKPMMVKLERDTSNKPKLTTTKFVNNYSETESSSFDLGNFVTDDAEYDLDVSSNDDTIYALLTNHDDDMRTKKNVLLKSTDGETWELYKNFRAEWELFDLEVSGKNLSVTCANCEDVFKLAYIISNDNGRSWQKYSLSDDTNGALFSGMANDKLFVVTQVRNPNDRKELISTLSYSDLMKKNSGWKQADISSLMTMSKEEDGVQVNYEFTDIESLYSADNYLIAEVTYTGDVFADEEEEIYKELSSAWISRDGGLTWNFFPLNNLKKEEILQLQKHGQKYHLVTNKKMEFPELDDSDESGLDLFGMVMKYFQEQTYSYYTLSQDDLDKTENYELSPKFQMEHGIGFNIDFKHSHIASYVDTLFLHKSEDDLKLEFYRLHD